MSEGAEQPPESALEARARARTEQWILEAVIGLGLCPFARVPFERGLVRIVATEVDDEAALFGVVDAEVGALASLSPEALETTLVVSPRCLLSFDGFHDFVGLVTETVRGRGLEGVLQVASFHPDFRFGDAPEDDPANATNRSPYPTIHLLREQSIEDAVQNHPDPARIWKRNVEVLRGLSEEERERLRRP